MRSRPLGTEFTPEEAARLAEFEAAPDAPESAVFTCPWPKCPHGDDCVHADWQLGDAT